MSVGRLHIVLIGLSITSSWGNGHATTYRALVKGLVSRGHDVLFLERDVPWYAAHRDLPEPPLGRTALYGSLVELARCHAEDVRGADLVVVGSYVPEGAEVGEWVLRTARGVRAFYDIDTPVTLLLLDSGRAEYLNRSLVPRYDLYLSFTGGPTLDRLEAEYGAARARALYCSVDADLHGPPDGGLEWDLGYLGTHSEDRYPALKRLLFTPARRWPEGRFSVAGSLYPERIAWPPNVEHRHHVAPGEHARYYGAQRFTLNITRAPMARVGYSPSVRLFEAAACATPIISDPWPGLEELFRPGSEILVARGCDEVLEALRGMSETERRRIGDRARRRVLAEHTGERRAEQLERYLRELAAPAEEPAPRASVSAARSAPA